LPCGILKSAFFAAGAMTTGVIAGTATSRARRMMEVCGAVALWISLGIGFHLSANAYLLLGIPLTAAFQWGVRRQPLCALWVRDAAPFRLSAAGWVTAAALAAYPCYRLAENVRARAYGVETLWFAAAACGAFAAAYALENFHRATARDLWFCLATAGAIGVGFLALNAVLVGAGHRSFTGRVGGGVASLLLYVPVVFVLEEVSFRGAFDAHVHHAGESREYLTAFAVSALWGLWHIPVALGQKPLPVLIAGLVGVHCAIGVPLSLAWRRSGNLFVTGSTHALVDAVRNALFVIPHL
jgi:Type II CAAX prenyl endopeptidase Rce1-like